MLVEAGGFFQAGGDSRRGWMRVVITISRGWGVEAWAYCPQPPF